MFNQNFFVTPKVYHTAGGNESVSLVTGSTALPSNGGKLLGLIALNAAADGYIQIFDGIAAPTGGDVPIISIKALSGTQVSLDLGVANCLPVQRGIVVALSTTGPTYTAGGSNMWVTAFWINS